MPRTSRTSVEFTVDGTTYEAKFSHQHASRDEKTGKERPYMDGTLGVQHVTTCRLYRKGDSTQFVSGRSRCSMKDTYDWRYGLKCALTRAIERTKLIIGEWKHPTVDGVEDKTSRLVFVPDEDTSAVYARWMGSFYTELPLKNYWPHVTPGTSGGPTGEKGALEGFVVDQVVPPVPVQVSANVVRGLLPAACGGIVTKVIPTPRPTGPVPARNLHGLGYVGD